MFPVLPSWICSHMPSRTRRIILSSNSGLAAHTREAWFGKQCFSLQYRSPNHNSTLSSHSPQIILTIFKCPSTGRMIFTFSQFGENFTLSKHWPLLEVPIRNDQSFLPYSSVYAQARRYSPSPEWGRTPPEKLNSEQISPSHFVSHEQHLKKNFFCTGGLKTL